MSLCVCLYLDFELRVDFMLGIGRWLPIFGRAELLARMQNMTEEAVKLKSDLRHTSMARARAEGREEKA